MGLLHEKQAETSCPIDSSDFSAVDEVVEAPDSLFEYVGHFAQLFWYFTFGTIRSNRRII